MKKIQLGHFPTPIQKIRTLDLPAGQSLYIKRDDYSGTEVSGNKIRKLEYCLSEAIGNHSDLIVTTGALQSNHCRATAAASARLSLGCEVILNEKPDDTPEGNLFLNHAFGADITYLPANVDRASFIEERLHKRKQEGKRPYFIPVGASNAVGSLGYRDCYKEIIEQEHTIGVTFDLIVLAVGSGGTYAGLWYENTVQQQKKALLGFAVCDSADHFRDVISGIATGMGDMNGVRALPEWESIWINDNYIGEGYAQSTPAEIRDIVAVARRTGILFDPCYTGKAFIGLMNEIKSGRLSAYENILFIHTGGLMGWTKQQRQMAVNLAERVNDKVIS